MVWVNFILFYFLISHFESFLGFCFSIFVFSELCILVGILLNARMKNLLKSLH